MKLNRVYKELFLRDIYKNLFVDELLYCVGANLVIMVRRNTSFAPDTFEVEFYRNNDDHMRVILYLKHVQLPYNASTLKEHGYYCTIYHYTGKYNDTARSVFIKSDSKIRLALVDKYKYWLKTLDNKKNF